MALVYQKLLITSSRLGDILLEPLLLNEIGGGLQGQPNWPLNFGE